MFKDNESEKETHNYIWKKSLQNGYKILASKRARGT